MINHYTALVVLQARITMISMEIRYLQDLLDDPIYRVEEDGRATGIKNDIRELELDMSNIKKTIEVLEGLAND